ncbi:hypothetical protein BMS3Bbin15_00876 [archaeon BMS3Bbin15]|nr:hypothetical protein BMS3Bbin15_00876 [archaeon BMS3Bbin15]
MEKTVGIIGASYSGLSAAISAAKEGAGVKVYEKKTDITQFACGEIYTSGWYGVETPPKNCRYYAAKNFIFHFSDENIAIPLPRDSLWVTERAAIQKKMYDTAKDYGVKFNLGESKLITETVKDYDYVIDASGFPSQSGYEGYFEKIRPQAAALYYDVSGDFSEYFDKDLHFWWTTSDNHGYVWLFPKTEDKTNIGIGWENKTREVPKFKDIKTFFQKNLKISINYNEVGKKRGAGILPLDRVKHFTHDNVAIVGEAAGLMNYTVEAGAHFAIASGRESGIAAAKGSLSDYDNYVKSELLKEVDISKMLYKKIGGMSQEKFRKVCKGIAKGAGMEIFHSKVKFLGLLRHMF